MTKQTYGLDVDKIKTLKDVRNVFGEMKLIGYFDPEDAEDEHYNLREYFTILQEPEELTFPPAPRKTLDEISQELDEKIDELIEKTKRNFYASKLTAERNYEHKFDKIFENFEYAKRNGNFPLKITLDYTTGWSAKSSYVENSLVIKQGDNNKGYYTIGNQRYLRYYMNEKPNFVSRFFMDKLLGFKWIDETT